MKSATIALLFAIALMLVGLVLMAWVDWRIALGAFLLMWGNNIQVRGGNPR